MEAARVAEGLTVKQAMKLLGLARSSYYRHVRGMSDYRVRGRQAPSGRHREALREVALKRVEAGHRRVRVCGSMGKTSGGRNRKQSDELLSIAQERGFAAAQADRSRLA